MPTEKRLVTLLQQGGQISLRTDVADGLELIQRDTLLLPEQKREIEIKVANMYGKGQEITLDVLTQIRVLNPEGVSVRGPFGEKKG